VSREKWTIGLAIGRQATLSGEILTFIGRQVTAGSSRSLYMYGVPGIRCSRHATYLHTWPRFTIGFTSCRRKGRECRQPRDTALTEIGCDPNPNPPRPPSITSRPSRREVDDLSWPAPCTYMQDGRFIEKPISLYVR
jgi:hypothetical protein